MPVDRALGHVRLFRHIICRIFQVNYISMLAVTWSEWTTANEFPCIGGVIQKIRKCDRGNRGMHTCDRKMVSCCNGPCSDAFQQFWKVDSNDCWYHCGGKGGKCSHCGTNGYCCSPGKLTLNRCRFLAESGLCFYYVP